MRQIALTEEFFEGAVSFQQEADWIKPWRIPFERRYLYPGNYGPYLGPAEMAAGVRLRFQTDSSKVSLTVAPHSQGRLFDLVIDEKLVNTASVAGQQETVSFENLQAGEKVVEVWLPQTTPCAIMQLLIDKGANASVVSDERSRWIVYGSSITHCMEAHSPARTWPGIVARARHFNLTSLGFAGDCHLEPMVARLIRDLPANFISLKVGINILGHETMSPRTFGPALLGFIQIIREKHPEIPIAVISPIVCKPLEMLAKCEMLTKKVGFSLPLMRDQIQCLVARLVEYGDEHLYYFDGRELLGYGADPYLCEDQVHPNGDGYELIGQRFLKLVCDKITV